MAKRGKVLRDPYSGPGLLMVEGQQYPFMLEGVWQSEIPPKPGLVVDVELDGDGKVQGVTAVPDSQLAKEQAEAAMAVARQKSAVLVSGLVARFGARALIATGLLLLGWFFLSAVSVQVPFLGKLEFSFWEVLGFLNSNNVLAAMDRRGSPSPGFYGFLAIVAIAGPFIHHFWKDKRALLGGLLPLVFMIVVGLMTRSTIQSSFGGNAAGQMGDMGKQFQEEAMKAVSLGFGTYVSILVSLYFAASGAKKFLVSKGSESEIYEKPQKAAA